VVCVRGLDASCGDLSINNTTARMLPRSGFVQRLTNGEVRAHSIAGVPAQRSEAGHGSATPSPSAHLAKPGAKRSVHLFVVRSKPGKLPLLILPRARLRSLFFSSAAHSSLSFALLFEGGAFFFVVGPVSCRAPLPAGAMTA